MMSGVSVKIYGAVPPIYLPLMEQTTIWTTATRTDRESIPSQELLGQFFLEVSTFMAVMKTCLDILVCQSHHP